MKRPSFQFYPGDWLNDAGLRMVSVEARGLWIEMICIMHQGSEYGHLKVNNKVILPNDLARMCGASISKVNKWIVELKEAGVCSISETNCIFSRRMIRDEEIRKIRAAGGVLGGNPVLKGSGKVENKVNLQPNLEPTPSSSSSSSSPTKDFVLTKQKRKISIPDDFIPTESHQEFAGLKGLSISKEMEKFRFHHEEKATLSGNWNSSFSKWLHNAVEFAKKNTPSQNRADQNKAAADLLTGRSKQNVTRPLLD